jgi:hypothetical protein
MSSHSEARRSGPLGASVVAGGLLEAIPLRLDQRAGNAAEGEVTGSAWLFTYSSALGYAKSPHTWMLSKDTPVGQVRIGVPVV